MTVGKEPLTCYNAFSIYCANSVKYRWIRLQKGFCYERRASENNGSVNASKYRCHTGIIHLFSDSIHGSWTLACYRTEIAESPHKYTDQVVSADNARNTADPSIDVFLLRPILHLWFNNETSHGSCSRSSPELCSLYL